MCLKHTAFLSIVVLLGLSCASKDEEDEDTTQDDDDSVASGCYFEPTSIVLPCIHEFPIDTPITGSFTVNNDGVPYWFDTEDGVQYSVWSGLHLYQEFEPMLNLEDEGIVTVVQRGGCREEETDYYDNVTAVFDGEKPQNLIYMAGCTTISDLAGWTVDVGDRCPSRGEADCWEHLHNTTVEFGYGQESGTLLQSESVIIESFLVTLAWAEESSGDMTCESYDGHIPSFRWSIVRQD